MFVSSWTCPTDEEQYKCHVLPVGLANIVPIKQYLIQMREDGGQWRTVATRSHGQPQKYRVEGLRIGASVEFRMISINILGRHSFPSDISPTYNVVGKISDSLLKTYIPNSFTIIIAKRIIRISFQL